MYQLFLRRHFACSQSQIQVAKKKLKPVGGAEFTITLGSEQVRVIPSDRQMDLSPRSTRSARRCLPTRLRPRIGRLEPLLEQRRKAKRIRSFTH